MKIFCYKQIPKIKSNSIDLGPQCQGVCGGGKPSVGGPGRRRGTISTSWKSMHIYTCLRWRICRKRQMHCRFVHLTDSLVALHSLSRGRSSSRKMRSVLSRINALLLATGVVPIWAYIGTKQNPADRPSRRPVLKVCRKRKYT